MAADFLNWAPDQPVKDAGDCAGLQMGEMVSMNCEKPSNFICEAKKPEK
jgi:hypothetical protein